jgi:methylisocitrate lyase
MLKDSRELIVCPGVYDGLSARIAMELGFKGMYMVCDAVLDALHSLFI